MLRAFFLALGAAALLYVVGGFAGGLLITLFSSNHHDRSVEAAMTGAFVTGPLAALTGFVVVLVVARSRSRTRQ